MRATLADLSIGLDGRQRLTISTGEDLRELWDELRFGEVRVDIKRWREKRSMDANAYAWVLMDKLAAAMNISKVEVYRHMIRNIGGVSTVVCVRDIAADRLESAWREQGLGWVTERVGSRLAGCVNVMLYFGSSVYDSKQMSSLIDRIVMECKEYGIETATPEELEKMKSGWKEMEAMA